MIRPLARVLLAALAVCLFGLEASADDETPRTLTIDARNVAFGTGEDAKSTVGKLAHRGTLRLTSPDTDFGGISGLIVSDDGSRFLAITDASHWLTGELRYRDGRLAGVTGSEIGPLLAPDGSILKGKFGDAEGLAGTLDGDVYVSFEGKHRIWRYPFASEGMRGKPSVVATPAELVGAPPNGGLEGIALLNDGRLLALTESFHDGAGNIRGWVLGTGADPLPVLLKQRSPFDVTDVRQLANGDVLTLERRFSTFGGVGFEMRRIPSPAFATGQVMDGEVVADVGMNFMIDNMEALSVRKGANGETLVYLVSDDNFNAPLQQTLIMMFELKD
jgi:hypothetical protein